MVFASGRPTASMGIDNEGEFLRHPGPRVIKVQEEFAFPDLFVGNIRPDARPGVVGLDKSGSKEEGE
jgi:hypothetical protein